MKKLLIALIFVAFSLPAFAQDIALTPVDYSPTIKNLTAYITEQMKKANVKGLSVALVDDQEVIWAEGFGVSDEKLKTPATSETLYRAGALSQIFTALEVQKLADNKRVKLDAPLVKTIPDFAIQSRYENTKDITLRSLMAQHSGLPFIYLKGMWEKDSQSLSQLVVDLHGDYLTAPPQTLFRYSYLDYDLLGRAIEIKTKMPFGMAMARDIFEPLDMTSTTFDLTDEVHAELTKGYRDGKEIPEVYSRDVPMAGVVTNVEDLAEFLKFQFSNGSVETNGEPKKIVSEKALGSMLENQYPDLPLDFGLQMGMGWMLSGLTIPGASKVAWQNGTYPPFASSMVVLPEEKLGIVILTNSPQSRKSLQDITGRALVLMMQDKYGRKADLEEHKPAEPPVIKLTQEKLDSYTGLYSAFGQVTEIVRHDDHLMGHFFDFDLDLLPIGDNLFMPEFNFLLFIHIKLPQYPLELLKVDGKDVAVVRGLPYPIALERIVLPSIPPSWQECLGKYTSDNTGEQIQFQEMSLENVKGLLTVKGKIEIKPFDFKTDHFTAGLIPTSDSEAVVAGLFWADGATVHLVRENGTIQLRCSGYSFTKQEPKKEDKR